MTPPPPTTSPHLLVWQGASSTEQRRSLSPDQFHSLGPKDLCNYVHFVVKQFVGLYEDIDTRHKQDRKTWLNSLELLFEEGASFVME